MRDCQGKSSFPELVGSLGKVVAEIIERENPFVDTVIVPEGSVVTRDFSCTRVRVWVNKKGIVYKVPVIG